MKEGALEGLRAPRGRLFVLGGVLAGASCVFWEAEFGRPEKCAPPLLSPFTHTPRGTK